ncbi:MAG: recombinase family protein [Chloroflexi bacterium]|nr:recombinase family protein [Chloroflexota bacterium]
MRAIGYCRQQSFDDSSHQLWEKAFLRYCKEQGIQPIEFFIEPVVSKEYGDSQYQRMLEYIRTSGSALVVVVPDSRHLGSDFEDVTRSILELDVLGAKVVCAGEGFRDPLQSALRLLGQPQAISQERSTRIRDALNHKALLGQALGRPPYGYRIGPDGYLQVVPDEALIVQLIFKLFTSEGLGLRRITQHLNQEAVPTRRGLPWNMLVVRGILLNRAYVGTYVRFGVRIPGIHPPIVSAEVFKLAQERFRKRKPRRREPHTETFLLSGLLYCGHCGGRMMGVTRHQRWSRRIGDVVQRTYRYYQCQARNNQSLCQYHTQRALLLDERALDRLLHVLETNPLPADSAQRRGEPLLSSLDEVDAAQRRFLRAFKRAAQGAISIYQLGESLTQLEKARLGETAVDHEQIIQELKAAIRSSQAWENMTMRDKKALLTKAKVRVIVTEGNIEVLV